MALIMHAKRNTSQDFDRFLTAVLANTLTCVDNTGQHREAEILAYQTRFLGDDIDEVIFVYALF